MIEQHLPVLVPLMFLLAALIVPAVGVFNRRLVYPIALLATISSFGFGLVGLKHILAHGPMSYRLGGWVPPIGIEYVLDTLSAFVTLVVVGIALLVMIYARTSTELELSGKEGPYFSVTMLFLAGLTGMVVTGDLFNLYVFLEIASLSGYALVAAGEKRATVAAFRYLLLGTIGASFYLLGLAFIFIETGSLNMADVAKLLPDLYREPTVITGAGLMITGIGIKMALFPLHGWLPDAYTYAPSTSSALLAPIGTKVAAYVLIRILFFVYQPGFVEHMLPITDVVAWLAAAGVIFGSVMAIAQKELKRMLAYSSVAQIGYIGLGIGMASPLGLIGAVLHVLNHAFMKACLFMVAGNLRAQVGHSNIPDFNESLRGKMPWTMAAFSVAALSMVGLPPTAGFFSKWYLVLAGIEESRWIFVAVILLSSLLNAVYFFRVLEKIYMRSATGALAGSELSVEPGSTSHEDAQREVRFPMLLPTLILAAGILLLGLFNAFIVTNVITFIIPEGL